MAKYLPTRNGRKRRTNKILQAGAYQVWLSPGVYYTQCHESKPYIFRTISGAVTCAVREGGIVEPIL